MATVHADPESQEKIDDGTAKGGWTWPWILAVVLGLVVVVLLILWACGVFSGSSELANERIVVLPRRHGWETISDADQRKLTIGWEYKPQNGRDNRYILINKDDEEKVKEWAKEIILEAAAEGKDAVTLADRMKIYEALKPLSFAVEKDGKETHADEILTYAELAEAMKMLANTASAIAQHRARLAVKTLKLLADDNTDASRQEYTVARLNKMAPTDEIDEAVKVANKIKQDIKAFFEDVLIPTANKINIAVEPEEKTPKDMIVELLELFVAQGGPIADKFIEMKERIVKDIIKDIELNTIAEILSDEGKPKAAASTDKVSKDEQYQGDQTAFDKLWTDAFETDNETFRKLRTTYAAVEAEYLRAISTAFEARRERAGAPQQEIVAIYDSCRDNIIALSTQYVRPKIADVFITEAAYDAKVRDLSERSGRYVDHLTGVRIPAQQQPAQAPPAAQEPQQQQRPHRADPPAQEQNVRPPPATVQDDTAAPAQQPPLGQRQQQRGQRKGRGKGGKGDGEQDQEEEEGDESPK